MKKKSHPEFVRALKARNLKITVVGTYENCLSRVAVRCDVCGWEWAPVGGSLLRGHGCPKCAGTMRKSHAEFVEELKSRRDDVIIVGPYVKALEKTRFRFLKCGHEWDVTPAHILNGRGCPLCAHSRLEGGRGTRFVVLAPESGGEGSGKASAVRKERHPADNRI